MNIKEKLESFDENVKSRKIKRNILIEECEDLKEEIENINIELLEKSLIVLEKLSEKQRSEACAQMEELCTLALQYAVSPDLKAEIDIGRLRNKPAAQLFVVNNKTGVKTVPLDDNGGGIVDIISTALRYIVSEIWVDGPVMLDEAYKHLSKEYTPAIADFIKKISADFGRQTILSTHNDFIAQAAERKICVTLDENEHSKISIITEEEVSV